MQELKAERDVTAVDASARKKAALIERNASLKRVLAEENVSTTRASQYQYAWVIHAVSP